MTQLASSVLPASKLEHPVPSLHVFEGKNGVFDHLACADADAAADAAAGESIGVDAGGAAAAGKFLAKRRRRGKSGRRPRLVRAGLLQRKPLMKRVGK